MRCSRNPPVAPDSLRSFGEANASLCPGRVVQCCGFAGAKLVVDPAFTLLFDLVVDTGLRLFEAYRVRVDSFDLERRIIRVDGSKGARGLIRPRVVPIGAALAAKLCAWCDGRIGLIFPFWDGSKVDRPRATARLSHRFTTLF